MSDATRVPEVGDVWKIIEDSEGYELLRRDETRGGWACRSLPDLIVQQGVLHFAGFEDGYYIFVRSASPPKERDHNPGAALARVMATPANAENVPTVCVPCGGALEGRYVYCPACFASPEVPPIYAELWEKQRRNPAATPPVVEAPRVNRDPSVKFLARALMREQEKGPGISPLFAPRCKLPASSCGHRACQPEGGVFVPRFTDEDLLGRDV